MKLSNPQLVSIRVRIGATQSGSRAHTFIYSVMLPCFKSLSMIIVHIWRTLSFNDLFQGGVFMDHAFIHLIREMISCVPTLCWHCEGLAVKKYMTSALTQFHLAYN